MEDDEDTRVVNAKGKWKKVKVKAPPESSAAAPSPTLGVKRARDSTDFEEDASASSSRVKPAKQAESAAASGRTQSHGKFGAYL